MEKENVKKEEVKEIENLFEDDQQPVVLSLDKKALKGETRLKAEGEFFDFSGYLASMKNNISNIIALLGAILVYLSPYMIWLKKTVSGETRQADLLDLAGEYSEIALNQKSLMVFGIVILVMAICMLILSARESIRPLRPYADNYFLRFIPAIIVVVMFVLVIKNKEYSGEIIKNTVETGVGQVFLVVGVVMYSISVIFDFMNRGNQYE